MERPKCNKKLTKLKIGCNNSPAYWQHQILLGGVTMEIIVAGIAFAALFSLWVILPKKLLKK